ncbi:MAG: PAS domain-containing protein [Candidatus Auribacterota bacterium]|nr:PAS domain-containing protein [Candidatus Auribacterota bacterium]
MESVLNNIRFFIDAVSGNGRIVFWNDTAATMTGYPAQRICAEPEPWKILYPDETYRSRLFIDASKKGWDIRGELWKLTCADGSVLPLTISVFEVNSLLKNLNAVKMAVGVRAPSPDAEIEIPGYELEIQYKGGLFRLFPEGFPQRATAGNICTTLRDRLLQLDALSAK